MKRCQRGDLRKHCQIQLGSGQDNPGIQPNIGPFSGTSAWIVRAPSLGPSPAVSLERSTLMPLLVAEVGRTIRRLKEEGQSIVLVEQNLQLALEVADQAVILNTGRCVFTGNAAEIPDNEELIAQNLGVFHAH